MTYGEAYKVILMIAKITERAGPPILRISRTTDKDYGAVEFDKFDIHRNQGMVIVKEDTLKIVCVGHGDAKEFDLHDPDCFNKTEKWLTEIKLSIEENRENLIEKI